MGSKQQQCEREARYDVYSKRPVHHDSTETQEKRGASVSDYHLLRTSATQTIDAFVRGIAILDALSKRAPVIVAITLCAALVSYWVNAPLWLPYGLAIIVGSLALVLMAARGRRSAFATGEGFGSSSSKGWIAQELAGQGTPPGFYLLGFFAFVTIMLTGFEGPYAMPSWAALALGVAWGIINAHYSCEDGSDA